MADVAGGDKIAAQDVNNAAYGQVGSLTVGSDGTATSGTTESAVDVVTSTLKAGLRYKISWQPTWLGSVVADRFLLRIRVGSGIAGTQLVYAVANVIATAGNSAVVNQLFVAYFTASSAGAQQFSGTFQRDSGTGTLTPKGGGSNPRYMTVEYFSGL